MLHRRLCAGAIALLLGACNGNVGTLPTGGQPSASGGAHASGRQKLRATIHVHIPRRHRHHRRERFISPSTKGMTIAFTGPTVVSETIGLTPSSPGCATGSSGTTCTITFMLAPCASSTNCYTGSVTTYDNVSCSTSCTIPGGAHALSANQSVGFAIVRGQSNAINLTLGGIPASVAIVPGGSSTLTGSSASGFTISKCVTTPQHVTVAGFDADNNQIVGPGALASATLSSDDAVHLAVATPAPSASPDAFALVPPATLVAGSSIPNANSVVHLTAGITPVSDSGATAPPNANTKVTFNTDICGVVTTYPIPSPAASPNYSPNPSSIVAGPDGALWFNESGYICCGGRIGTITTAGVITSYTTFAGNQPVYLTVGPDHNIWFTETNGGSATASLDVVGKMTTSGVTTDYSANAGGVYFTGISGIAFGTDGNLWFLENSKNNVDKMTTTGAAQTRYATGGSLPQQAIAGPDGQVWFTEFGTSGVGKVDTAGTVTQYGGLAGGTWNITTGPDGNMWFTEGGVSKIGHMTTSGTGIQEFTTPTTNAEPSGITVGPDGALWFTECTTGKIGRITTTGAATEFALPNAAASPNPLGIVTGPDNNLWFVECNTNDVARMQ